MNMQISVIENILEEINLRNSSKDPESILFWVVLALNEFQGKVEEEGNFIVITLFSGIFFDDILSSPQKDLFLKEMENINEYYGVFSVYEIDVDGEVVIKTMLRIDGNFGELELCYNCIFKGIFDEVSRTWRQLMNKYY